jgi:hypothetical protein
MLRDLKGQRRVEMSLPLVSYLREVNPTDLKWKK